MGRAALLLASAGLAASASSLIPLAWTPLPYGTVTPGGWLARQLRIQGDGLSGHFESFWLPVANSTWTGGSNKEGDWVGEGEGRRRVCNDDVIRYGVTARSHAVFPPPQKSGHMSLRATCLKRFCSTTPRSLHSRSSGLTTFLTHSLRAARAGWGLPPLCATAECCTGRR